MGHDLHSQPRGVTHRVVAGVGGGSSQGMGDSVDDGGCVCGASDAVGLRDGDLLNKVLLAVVLTHHLWQLIPHLIGNALDALGAADAGGSNVVARFYHADLHTQRVHLVVQAIRGSLHSKLGDAV